ncbi:MAG: SRPBCC domain-containing protein [Angustibacter sp.]
MSETIVIEQVISAGPERVFAALVTPTDLVNWHNAGDGWSTPYAEVEPRVGGALKIAYADPAGTVVFDLIGEVTVFDAGRRFSYVMPANLFGEEAARQVDYQLSPAGAGTNIRLEFDIEHMNSLELQREGWGEHISNLAVLLGAAAGDDQH